MINRRPLKILGYILFGAFSSVALMTGSNAYASGMSTEDILRYFLEAIIRYFANESYENIIETLEYYQEKMKEVYGGEDEHAAKKSAADGQIANKQNSIEEKIYNDNAISDAADIKTGCRKPNGPIVDNAKQAINDSKISMQEQEVFSAEIRQKQDAKKRRIMSVLNEWTSNPDKLPSGLNASCFYTEHGYKTAEDANNALKYLTNITEHVKDSNLGVIRTMADTNEKFEQDKTKSLSKMSIILLANNALTDIYLHRIRDRNIAARAIQNTTEIEAEILKVHANDAGLALIDLYNYEAAIAAHNYEYIKDIMTGRVEETQSNDTAIPSLVRATKYLVQTKAIENAFSSRLLEQQRIITQLQAALTNQAISRGAV